MRKRQTLLPKQRTRDLKTGGSFLPLTHSPPFWSLPVPFHSFDSNTLSISSAGFSHQAAISECQWTCSLLSGPGTPEASLVLTSP